MKPMTVKFAAVAGILAGILTATLAGANPNDQPDCVWCGFLNPPDREELTAEITIAPADEPGRKLTLTGIIYEPDSETPAAGVMLYLYHTNAEGEYPTRGDETGNGRRHGYLRGWLVTDAEGRYTVHTIKPANYPGGNTAAHIHMTVKESDREEYWIDPVWFEGDPAITEQALEQRSGRGGPAIVELQEQDDGTLRAVRDVVLMPDGGY